MNKKKTISFWLDKEKDKDIIGWLAEQRNQSQAIRDVLRAAIIPSPTLDLGAIRAIMEAVLDERLTGLSLNTGREPVNDPTTDDMLRSMF